MKKNFDPIKVVLLLKLLFLGCTIIKSESLLYMSTPQWGMKWKCEGQNNGSLWGCCVCEGDESEMLTMAEKVERMNSPLWVVKSYRTKGVDFRWCNGKKRWAGKERRVETRKTGRGKMEKKMESDIKKGRKNKDKQDKKRKREKNWDRKKETT